MDHLENDKRVAEFRFQKDDVYDLPGVLQISDEIVSYNGEQKYQTLKLSAFF